MVRSDHCCEPGLVRTVKAADNFLFPRSSNWRLVQACAKVTTLRAASRLQWLWGRALRGTNRRSPCQSTIRSPNANAAPKSDKRVDYTRMDDGGYQAALRRSKVE